MFSIVWWLRLKRALFSLAQQSGLTIVEYLGVGLIGAIIAGAIIAAFAPNGLGEIAQSVGQLMDNLIAGFASVDGMR